MLNGTYQQIRRVLVFVVGISIVLVGVVMLVTPGPAILVIPAGLAVLATEFLWARRLLNQIKERLPGGGKSASAKAASANEVETGAPDQPAPKDGQQAHGENEAGKPDDTDRDPPRRPGDTR